MLHSQNGSCRHRAEANPNTASCEQPRRVAELVSDSHSEGILVFSDHHEFFVGRSVYFFCFDPHHVHDIPYLHVHRVQLERVQASHKLESRLGHELNIPRSGIQFESQHPVFLLCFGSLVNK